MSFQISRLTILLFGLLLCGLAGIRQARAGDKPGLQVQVSLISNSAFSLGEPIVLKYEIRNTSTDRAETYMGKDKMGWVAETLTDLQGHLLPAEVEHPWRTNGGVHDNGVSVSPMSSATGYIVVNPWTIIHVPGKYKFAVHTRLSYALGTRAEEIIPSRYGASWDVAVNDFTFSLNITPHTSQTLKQAAETLRRAAEAADLRAWSSAAVEALFSMPEADVSSVWQEMISDPTTPRYALGLAAEQLVRLHSITASDLVAQMRWEPARPLEPGETAIGAVELARMSQIGDARLRKHIDGLCAAHGENQEFSLEVAD